MQKRQAETRREAGNGSENGSEEKKRKRQGEGKKKAKKARQPAFWRTPRGSDLGQEGLRSAVEFFHQLCQAAEAAIHIGQLVL